MGVPIPPRCFICLDILKYASGLNIPNILSVPSRPKIPSSLDFPDWLDVRARLNVLSGLIVTNQ